MFKKILFLGAAAALAFTATTASAGSAPAVYDVAPLSGSIKVLGSEEAENGSSKIFKDSANNKTLIRLALGNDPDTAVPNEKNYVLGLALPQSSCEAEIVVWNKLAGVIAAEVATVEACNEGAYSGPAEGKNGTVKAYGLIKLKFIGAGDGCGAIDTSLLSGRARGLGYSVAKISGNVANQEPTPVYTLVSLEVSRLIGEAYANDESNQQASKSLSEEGEYLLVVDGSFKANLAPNKKLGTSSQAIEANDCAQQVEIN